MCWDAPKMTSTAMYPFMESNFKLDPAATPSVNTTSSYSSGYTLPPSATSSVAASNQTTVRIDF